MQMMSLTIAEHFRLRKRPGFGTADFDTPCFRKRLEKYWASSCPNRNPISPTGSIVLDNSRQAARIFRRS